MGPSGRAGGLKVTARGSTRPAYGTPSEGAGPGSGSWASARPIGAAGPGAAGAKVFRVSPAISDNLCEGAARSGGCGAKRGSARASGTVRSRPTLSDTKADEAHGKALEKSTGRADQLPRVGAHPTLLGAFTIKKRTL